MRRLLRLLFRRALRIFFRRIEVEGPENVPAEGPVVFVVNHPNGLVDPLLLLCFAPRRVSFLAKAPLFHMPVVGSIVRAFGSIPVHRRQDKGTDVSKNRETFDAARKLLAGGGTLALFPEGASHDAPQMLPMKTGAARIALGAAANMGSGLSIVPAGLFYTRKQNFRSAALVVFGAPLAVAPASLDPDGEPSAGDVRALTQRIGDALGALVLQAETADALDLVRRAQRIFEESRGGLAEELSLSRRFVDGHRALAAKDPARLEKIRGEILRFEADRREAGLTLADLAPERIGAGAFARLIAQNVGALLLAPLAAAGALVHYPAYRLAGFIARRVSQKHEDVLSTVKVGTSMLLFPATWAAGAYAAFRLGWGWPGALATLVLLPLSGWAALTVAEALDSILARAWALVHAAAAKTALKSLFARRDGIRREITRIAEELESQGTADS